MLLATKKRLVFSPRRNIGADLAKGLSCGSLYSLRIALTYYSRREAIASLLVFAPL
jgi:hypothetical protein